MLGINLLKKNTGLSPIDSLDHWCSNLTISSGLSSLFCFSQRDSNYCYVQNVNTRTTDKKHEKLPAGNETDNSMKQTPSEATSFLS